MGPGKFITMFLSVSAALVAGAQEPPPFKLVRYDEDYSYLKDESRRTEPLDRIKYIPLDREGKSFLTLGGEVRERYEYFHNSLWGQGPQDNDGYLLQRYMVHANARITKHFRLFTEFKSGLEE